MAEQLKYVLEKISNRRSFVWWCFISCEN